MKVLIVVACLVILASARFLSVENADFEDFKHKFGKTYKTAVEEGFRLKIFLNNLKTIADHNKLYKASKVSFNLGVNQHADLTTKEFSEMTNGFRRPAHYKPQLVFESSAKAAPDSIDWRDYGCVGPTHDRGQCGTIWPFLATATIEGQNCASTGNVISLSEQNLIDCTLDYGNLGCNGGTLDSAFQYVIDNNGIDTEASYPYEGRIGLCRYSALNKGGSVSAIVDIPSANEDALKEATGTTGPTFAYIDASHVSFQFYTSGVYYEPLCSQQNLNMGVMVAGYGTEDGQDYWLVENLSDGPSWGENGFIKMSRNRDNNCGIATAAGYPVV